MIWKSHAPTKSVSLPILSLAGLTILFLTGCSFLQTLTAQVPSARRMHAEAVWVRSSLSKEILGPRRTFTMNPLVTEKTVYQGSPSDGIVAFDRATGREIWRIPIQNGVVSGAQLVGDHLYFGGNDGFFYCVKSETGEVAWSYPTRAENLAAPLVDEGTVYFLSGNNTLYALSADKGKQIWSYSRTGTTPITIRGGTQPAVSGGLVYAGFSDGFFVALNRKDGTLSWERQLNQNPRFRDVEGSPVIDGDMIFVSGFDSALYALGRKDGQIQWKVDEGSFGPVTLQGDKLFYSGTQGHVMAVDKKSGKTLWTYALKTGVASQPSLFKGMVVFGESEGPLRFVTMENGQPIYGYHTGRGVLARPFADDKTGELIVMSTEGNVHSLHVTWPRAQADLPWMHPK